MSEYDHDHDEQTEKFGRCLTCADASTTAAAGADRLAEWPTVCPERFARARLSDLDDELCSAIVEWHGRDVLTNLVLIGAVGVGKSHAAMAAAVSLWMRGWTVERWAVVRLLDRLNWNNPDNGLVMRAVEDADLLVLDDLGAEPMHEWELRRVGSFVNERWDLERPSIVTTNRSLPDLKDALGERSYSRLFDDALVLELGGPDRRLQRGS